MSNEEPKVCECCGAKLVEYTYKFNKGMARCLWKMGRARTWIKISRLGLTTSQYVNFAKLRYWGLIEKQVENGIPRDGVWRISDKGRQFLNGEISIESKAVTFRNAVVRHEGEHLFFRDVTEGYQYTEEFRDQAREQIRGSSGTV